mmetsp:Transcript_23013/g.54699  ORF Transcript_23013/g.54699 Transcript_23013/m.54699 type:complete len:291 (+) Transcript_23013:553-1425(+)
MRCAGWKNCCWLASSGKAAKSGAPKVAPGQPSSTSSSSAWFSGLASCSGSSTGSPTRRGFQGVRGGGGGGGRGRFSSTTEACLGLESGSSMPVSIKNCKPVSDLKYENDHSVSATESRFLPFFTVLVACGAMFSWSCMESSAFRVPSRGCASSSASSGAPFGTSTDSASRSAPSLSATATTARARLSSSAATGAGCSARRPCRAFTQWSKALSLSPCAKAGSGGISLASTTTSSSFLPFFPFFPFSFAFSFALSFLALAFGSSFLPAFRIFFSSAASHSRYCFSVPFSLI